jgi:hypothetical protein
LEYLRAEVVVKIIDSSGLKRLSADFSKERILEYYQEYNSENGQYITDTDNDGLKNYEEIAFESELIKFDPDLVLPTLSDCIDYSSYTYVVDGLTRYKKNKTGNDPVKWESLIKSVLVLPILSDPISADGDKDGILDKDEIVWNGIDERYKDVSPLKADTVESLYPELVLEKGNNRSSNSIYFTINKNEINFYVKYKFFNEFSKLLNRYIYIDDKYEKIFISGVENRLSKPHLNGIDKYYNQSGFFYGSKYDFYPGMKIEVNFNFIKSNDNNAISIYIDKAINKTTSFAGVTYNGFQWSPSTISRILVYSHYGEIEVEHEYLEGVFAHELAHALGVSDAYGDANKGYQIYPAAVSNNEITMGTCNSGDIAAGDLMLYAGCANTNTIEMILQAHVENTYQYFSITPKRSDITPFTKYSVSKAIKLPYDVYYNSNDKHFYYLDQNINEYVQIGESSDDVDLYIKENYNED